MSLAELEKESSERCPKCGAFLVAAARETPAWLSEALEEIGRVSEIEDFVAREDRMEVETSRLPEKKTFQRLQRKMKRFGYLCAIREADGGAAIFLIKAPKPPKKNVALSIFLLLATILSTFFAGYLLSGSAADGFLFSFAVMTMLGAHELGHLFAARKNRIETSLPYFIPFPSFLGTLGAIVEMREPPPSRDAMVETGSYGPIAGFLASLLFITVGLALSSPAEKGEAPFAPLIFSGIRRLLGLPPSLELHPFAFAGWVMAFITFLNLMPLGQLDGGHVARAVLGPAGHYYTTVFLSLALFSSGFFFPQYPFWLWGFLAFILFSREHPGALDDVHPISSRSKAIAGACLAIFILCFPIPGWW